MADFNRTEQAAEIFKEMGLTTVAMPGSEIVPAAQRGVINAAEWIDLERADTRSGVQTLEAVGLIGVGRALEILDAPIEEDERPV